MLANVEEQLAKFPQVAKWRVAVDEMRRELNRLNGLEDNDSQPTESDLGKELTTNPKALKVLKTLSQKKAVGSNSNPAKDARDKALSEGWRRQDEADFQVDLQARFVKVVDEKEGLLAELKEAQDKLCAALEGKSAAAELTLNLPQSPERASSMDRGSSDEFKLLFENEFGDESNKPSLDLLGLGDDAFSGSSSSSSSRSSGRRRSSVGGGRSGRRGSVGLGRAVGGASMAAEESRRRRRLAASSARPTGGRTSSRRSCRTRT